MAYTPDYMTIGKPSAPKKYKQTAKAPTYKQTEKAPTYKSTAKAPAQYKIGTYTSQYGDQLDSALNNVVNWKYDPMKDASYQALAKVYGARGNVAAKDTLADAAGLNGGMQTSYAVSAAQQARNQYNQELAALIPDLEAAAYTKAQGTLGALREADNTAYGRFRDTEGDRQWLYGMDYQKYRDLVGDEQWKYGVDYQKYRDKVGDNQWLYNANYQKYRDNVADDQWLYSQNYNNYRDLMSDYQWANNWNMDLYQWNKAQEEKEAAASSGGGGGGGGGRGRSGGGGSGGGYVGGYSGDGLDALIDKAAAQLDNNKPKYKTTTDAYGQYYKSGAIKPKYGKVK